MQRFRPIFWFVVLLMMASLACSLVTGDDEEPTAEPEPTIVQEQEVVAPTNTPVPLPTEPPPTEPPTAEAEPTEAPPTESAPDADLPAVELELDSVPYAHYLGFFDVYPPLGWLMEEGDGGTTFTAPDDSGYFELEVTNTATTLDGVAFERFVDAREINYYGQFDDYVPLDYEIDPDFGQARVSKEFTVDGIPQKAFTFYDQYGTAIYAYDFWADSDVADAYAPVFQEIIDSSSIDFEAVAESATPYYWIRTFYGPGDLFSIDVPIAWTFETSEDESTIVDTFYSPDDHAIIQNITYDDGEVISRSDAGAFALGLLKEFYASDIQISDDQVQPDGSERLTWSSPSGEYSGISFLETRGSTFLLFSVLWDDAYEDTYFDTLTYTIETYEVPE